MQAQVTIGSSEMGGTLKLTPTEFIATHSLLSSWTIVVFLYQPSQSRDRIFQSGWGNGGPRDFVWGGAGSDQVNRLNNKIKNFKILFRGFTNLTGATATVC